MLVDRSLLHIGRHRRRPNPPRTPRHRRIRRSQGPGHAHARPGLNLAGPGTGPPAAGPRPRGRRRLEALGYVGEGPSRRSTRAGHLGSAEKRRRPGADAAAAPGAVRSRACRAPRTARWGGPCRVAKRVGGYYDEALCAGDFSLIFCLAFSSRADKHVAIAISAGAPHARSTDNPQPDAVAGVIYFSAVVEQYFSKSATSSL